MVALLLVAGLLQSGLTARWTQFDVTPVEAQALVYRLYIDAQPSVILQGVTCQTVVTQTECSAPMPVPPNPGGGNHTARLTAANDIGESDPSDPVTFRYKGRPPKPENLSITEM